MWGVRTITRGGYPRGGVNLMLTQGDGTPYRNQPGASGRHPSELLDTERQLLFMYDRSLAW